MAKKKTSTPSGTAVKKTSANPKAPRRNDEVTTAHEELEFARAQLRQAEEHYDEVKARAVESAANLPTTEQEEGGITVEDVIDRVLEFVKKQPGAGVLGAAGIGFIFGRITRR